MPLRSWSLNVAYLLTLLTVSPLLLYRRLVYGKYRDGWKAKILGQLPERISNRPCLWIHAVSVGEVLSLRSLLDELRRHRPDLEFVISTTTSTGLDVAGNTFPDDTVCYFPLDFSWSVRRAISRIRPAAVVLVELELWPNFVLSAERAGIPLLLINGRLSRNSFRGYRWIRPLMKRLLAAIDVLAVQNEEYAQRLKQLGAPSKRIVVTGSIKFDHVESDRTNPKTRELRASFGIGENESVFVAGSTHAPEEEIAIDCYQSLRREHAGLRLVLVPRHKERFEQLVRQIERRGLPLIRRSQVNGKPAVHFERTPMPVHVDTPHFAAGTKPQPNENQPPVLLLDTLGELSACWGLADIAFVGGSLTNRGGQNMIEPAAYAAAVLFGPNTRNFRDVVELLLSHEAATVVNDGPALTKAVGRLLDQPELAKKQGESARRVVEAQQGATARTVGLILQRLAQVDDHPPAAPQRFERPTPRSRDDAA